MLTFKQFSCNDFPLIGIVKTLLWGYISVGIKPLSLTQAVEVFVFSSDTFVIFVVIFS